MIHTKNTRACSQSWNKMTYQSIQNGVWDEADNCFTLSTDRNQQAFYHMVSNTDSCFSRWSASLQETNVLTSNSHAIIYVSTQRKRWGRLTLSSTSAPGFLSGWYCFAQRWYAFEVRQAHPKAYTTTQNTRLASEVLTFLISFSDACLLTPSTS